MSLAALFEYRTVMSKRCLATDVLHQNGGRPAHVVVAVVWTPDGRLNRTRNSMPLATGADATSTRTGARRPNGTCSTAYSASSTTVSKPAGRSMKTAPSRPN